MSEGAPAIVLASASPRRRALLDFLGISADAMPSDVEEDGVKASTPRALAMKLAILKAQAVAESLGSDGTVLGADTVVAMGDVLFGKPEDADDARRMLAALRGKTHQVITGVAVTRAETGTEVDARSTDVTMRDFTDAEMEKYVASGEPFDKAGAYGFQGEGGSLIERVEGCQCNVVGLPMICLLRLLRGTVDLAEHPVPCRCEPWPHVEPRPLPWEK